MRMRGASSTTCGSNHKSPVAEEALKFFAALYELERKRRNSVPRSDSGSAPRNRARSWTSCTNGCCCSDRRATDGTAIAKAIDYSLGRWPALIRFLDDGTLPIDNNWVENRIRPIALGTFELAVRRISCARESALRP